MRVLITGAGGFVGRHLTDFLRSEKRIRPYFFEGDIRQAGAMSRCLKKVKPDRIFHLAGLSHSGSSWKEPAEFYKTNVLGQLNLLEGLRNLKKLPRVHLALSSEEYGPLAAPCLPCMESQPLNPISPYGVSKAAQDMMGYQYFKNYGVPVVRTRAFIHVGPGQKDCFVVSNFARQIARIEAGLQPAEIRVGNLAAIRDFTDARDVVRAYWLALEKGRPGDVYNVCSGRPRSIRSVLDGLLKLSRAKVRIVPDKARIRPSDIACSYGSAAKLRKQSGWAPRICFEDTLVDILNSWRKQFAKY